MFVIIKKQKHMEKTDSSPLSRQALYADKKQFADILSIFIGSGRWFYSGRNYLLLCLQLGGITQICKVRNSRSVISSFCPARYIHALE